MQKDEKYYGKKALELSKKNGGKITLNPTVRAKTPDDFATVYTPGVAEVSKEIKRRPESSYALTWRWNTIFIITNGTRVLGLGDIGPLASLPVMEGKSLLYKTLGGVNAVPIPIASRDPKEFVEVVNAISLTPGGIHLEDISSPFCFDVLESLREKLSVPVWHDDQQGTAAATLAGLINAFKLADKDLKKAKIVLVGAGAANISLFGLLKLYGVDTRNVIVGDSKGPLYRGREDEEIMKNENRWKYSVLNDSNWDRVSKIEESFDNADAIVGFSRSGTIKPAWIKRMSARPIVFANANPVPEISPNKAKEAGAYIVSTGRSDYPNQINNSLVFPGLFRGIIDSHTKKIGDDMAIVAAKSLAKFAERRGLRRDYIIPKMNEREIYPSMAASVAEYASKSGNASVKGDWSFFYKKAKKIIAKESGL